MEDDTGGQADLFGGIAFCCCENGCVEGGMACSVSWSGNAHALGMAESVGVQDQVVSLVFGKHV